MALGTRAERIADIVGVGLVVVVCGLLLTAAGYQATKTIDHEFRCVEAVLIEEILHTNGREAVIKLSDGSERTVSVNGKSMRKGSPFCTRQDWVYVGNKFKRSPETVDN